MLAGLQRISLGQVPRWYQLCRPRFRAPDASPRSPAQAHCPLEGALPAAQSRKVAPVGRTGRRPASSAVPNWHQAQARAGGRAESPRQVPAREGLQMREGPSGGAGVSGHWVRGCPRPQRPTGSPAAQCLRRHLLDGTRPCRQSWLVPFNPVLEVGAALRRVGPG